MLEDDTDDADDCIAEEELLGMIELATEYWIAGREVELLDMVGRE